LTTGSPRPGGPAGPFALAPLRYPEDALAPVISSRTLKLHHGRHHRAYMDRLNELVEDSPLGSLQLEDVVKRAASVPEWTAIFDNAAQAWNHDFYWRSLSPRGGRPAGRLKERIDADFGGYASFAARFVEAAGARFGSGWVWLVAHRGRLEIVSTANADTPIAHEMVCLLALDVWEHAYYLDYHDRRSDHAAAVIEHRLDWGFAAENLAGVS